MGINHCTFCCNDERKEQLHNVKNIFPEMIAHSVNSGGSEYNYLEIQTPSPDTKRLEKLQRAKTLTTILSLTEDSDSKITPEREYDLERSRILKEFDHSNIMNSTLRVDSMNDLNEKITEHSDEDEDVPDNQVCLELFDLNQMH